MSAYDIRLPCPRCAHMIRVRVTFAPGRVVTPLFAPEAHRCTEETKP